MVSAAKIGMLSMAYGEKSTDMTLTRGTLTSIARHEYDHVEGTVRSV